MDEAAALYDSIYQGVARSEAYRRAVLPGRGLPDWLIPLSAVDGADLERIAAELRLRPDDAFVAWRAVSVVRDSGWHGRPVRH